MRAALASAARKVRADAGAESGTARRIAKLLRSSFAMGMPSISVYIALTKPTYGLHGTPDPSKIDKNASHGCVRMTNWDANELAHLVKRGIVVRFKS
jgi:lipoprotein-anchoring transpeptidase ErfK/SrfK